MIAFACNLDLAAASVRGQRTQSVSTHAAHATPWKAQKETAAFKHGEQRPATKRFGNRAGESDGWVAASQSNPWLTKAAVKVHAVSKRRLFQHTLAS